MKEYVINAENMDEKELNRTIKEQAITHDKLIINNPESRHNICAGLIEDVEIEINGSAGYFVGTMVNGPRHHGQRPKDTYQRKRRMVCWRQHDRRRTYH